MAIRTQIHTCPQLLLWLADAALNQKQSTNHNNCNLKKIYYQQQRRLVAGAVVVTVVVTVLGTSQYKKPKSPKCRSRKTMPNERPQCALHTATVAPQLHSERKKIYDALLASFISITINQDMASASSTSNSLSLCLSLCHNTHTQ